LMKRQQNKPHPLTQLAPMIDAECYCLQQSCPGHPAASRLL
jgi:hypothetical protein